MFMKKGNYTIGNDKITIIDIVAINNFINLYNIYLDMKKDYDSCVDSLNARFSIDKQKDIIQEIYLKILQTNMENLNNLSSKENSEEAKNRIVELRKFSTKIKKYKNLLSILNISDNDTFSKFISFKSLREIENEVREKYTKCNEAYIMTISNEIYSNQDEVLRKKINDLYDELVSVKKYMEILAQYEDKLKKSSNLMGLFLKSNMNKKLKEELKKDTNRNFSDLSSKSGDISVLIGNEICKYSKYILPISTFTEKIYDDAMKALNKFDEPEDEIQISQNVSIVNNNSEIQKLRKLYDEYGVDSYYLEPSSALWYLNYNEALVKLKFCEDYYMKNNNCSAAGTYFQVEVLYMNSIEFKNKFDKDLSEFVDKYTKQEIIIENENSNIRYQKVM